MPRERKLSREKPAGSASAARSSAGPAMWPVERSSRSGTAWVASSHAAQTITPQTRSALTESAAATITGSFATAAMVMVTCTTTEQKMVIA